MCCNLLKIPLEEEISVGFHINSLPALLFLGPVPLLYKVWDGNVNTMTKFLVCILWTKDWKFSPSAPMVVP